LGFGAFVGFLFVVGVIAVVIVFLSRGERSDMEPPPPEPPDRSPPPLRPPYEPDVRLGRNLSIRTSNTAGGILMAIRTWPDRFGRDVVTVEGSVKRDLGATRHFLATPSRPVFLPNLEGGPAVANLWSTRDRAAGAP